MISELDSGMLVIFAFLNLKHFSFQLCIICRLVYFDRRSPAMQIFPIHAHKSLVINK